MATEQDCLDALRRAARELGKSPSKAEYEALGLTPASATVIRNLGGWNEAKDRAGLATNASTGSRVGPPPDGVDDTIRSRWEELSVDQRWHYRNVAWNTERTLRRRAELQTWVDEKKATEGCTVCDESDPACLDYHHRDAAEKDETVSQLVFAERSKGRLREEIENCEVLCANCHRAEHGSSVDHSVEIELRRRPYRLVARENEGAALTPLERKREWVRTYKARRGCVDCGHRRSAALDLHHVDPSTKTKSVSRFVSDGCTVQRLLREVALCEVICANCHRKLHAAAREDLPAETEG